METTTKEQTMTAKQTTHDAMTYSELIQLRFSLPANSPAIVLIDAAIAKKKNAA